MNTISDYIKFSRYIFLGVAILGTLLVIPSDAYYSFTLFSLFIVILSQFRFALASKLPKLMIVITLFEVFLVSYIAALYNGFIYLAFFAILIDSFTKIGKRTYLLSIVIGLGLIYTLLKTSPLNLIIIVTVFYSVIFLVLLQLRRESLIRIDTESLYDQIRRQNYELETAKIRLLEYSKQVEKMTQLEERNRISRELHDSIGHNLTGILMQVDAGIKVVSVNKEKGLEILSSAYKNISDSIESVRETVQHLRPKTDLEITTLEKLINNFQKTTGLPVKFETSGTPYKLFPSIEIALYKNTQEALTNAVRHGKADKIDVRLAYNNTSTELFISDNGCGTKLLTKGFGIIGMEERLELIGGTIQFKTENGFHIHITIPRKEM